MTLREGSLFSGYNGLGMAVSEVFGSEPAWFSEYEPPTEKAPKPAQGAAKILAHRYPHVPNLGDITAIDWDSVERVDILSGGFPCTDLSLAGLQAGLKPGTRSGLWSYFALAISKLRPRYVVIENVRGLLSAEAHSDVEPCPWCLGEGSGEPDLRALGAVLGDLANLGYDAQWCGLRAADIGAPHGRFRVFILAEDANVAVSRERGIAAPGQAEGGWAWPDTGGRDRASAADTDRDGCSRIGRAGPERRDADGRNCADAVWVATEPKARRSPADPSSQRADATQQPRLAQRTVSRGDAAADAHGHGLREQPVTQPGGSRSTLAELAGPDAAGSGASAALWGQYAGAIRRWELTIGRPAPSPTELTPKGSQRLSPQFVEWMMGLPAGHVTAAAGVNRNAQLKALGNGVVPQQAAAALRHMLASHQLLATA